MAAVLQSIVTIWGGGWYCSIILHLSSSLVSQAIMLSAQLFFFVHSVYLLENMWQAAIIWTHYSMTYFSSHFLILRVNQALILCNRMLSSDSVMLYYMPNAELFLLPQNTSQIHGLHCCFRLGLLSGVSLLLHCICCAVSHGLMLINLVFALSFTFNIKLYFCSIHLFSLCNSLLVFSITSHHAIH